MKEIKVNIFLQARSDSNRLPLKSLVPINKIPLTVLCAKRLMGKNFNLTVLTSTNESDNYLAHMLKENNINYFRGNLNNVYKRFLDCAKDLNEDDIIIRTTADNPFVDYSFVKNALNVFLVNNETYRGIDYKKHNVPYGMSLEIFRKKLLLKYKNSLTKNSKEHVTSHFYKYANPEIVKKNKIKKDLSYLSCTLDTFDDYKKINSVFNKFKNPTKVPWRKLIHSLSNYKCRNIDYLPKTKFTLGGAQIGNNYMNFKRLSIDKLFSRKLFLNNFTNIDTAFNYSKSHEEISKLNLKKNINIMTKLNYSIDDIQSKYYKENFYINFYKILISLNQSKVDTLLIHSYKDFKKNYSEIIKIFNKLQSLNLINNFGVSIYYPRELMFIMNNFTNFTVQIPINFVDHRWNQSEIIKKKKKSKSILIGRSIFLRGKLLQKEGYIINNKINSAYKEALFEIKKRYDIKSNLELCIGYVNSLSFLDYIVIGFENYNQIKKIIKYKNKKFMASQIKIINKKFNFLDTKYIDILKL
tara:strand:- start:1455 stop:3029 length:1575 start_codon:yes stop_codon:yes gene_type:complete